MDSEWVQERRADICIEMRNARTIQNGMTVLAHTIATLEERVMKLEAQSKKRKPPVKKTPAKKENKS
tara:strand:+ start:19664 stop:19864 length:201 start_codon:yes stop_codon:yes gene_type:complete